MFTVEALLAMSEKKAIEAIRAFAARDPLGYLAILLSIAEERARRG